MQEKIREIFTSIQGEGLYVGVKQVFVRFCGCNLNCNYCDTETDAKNAKSYTAQELADIINKEKTAHSAAITGGEPLLHTDFLKELLPWIKMPIYLETNATLTNELEEIINYTDIISADIKLPSATGFDTFKEHEKFLKLCKKHDKTTFAKVVFNDKITDEEIEKTIKIAQNNDLELILQPEMNGCRIVPSTAEIEKIFDKFLKKYKKVRLIPQTHKFLNVQ